MNRKIFFDVPGLVFFERLMRSCPPRSTNGGREFKEKLFLCSQEEKIQSDFASLMDKLGVIGWQETTFGHFFHYLIGQNTEVIGEREVIGYFGGMPHFNNISQKLESGQIDIPKSLGANYPFAVSVIHTLLLVTIESLDANLINARYENSEMSVLVHNLLPLAEFKNKMEAGMRVWTHLGSIVAVSADQGAEEFSLKLQKDSEKFMQICARFEEKGINTARLHYRAWAEIASTLFDI